MMKISTLFLPAFLFASLTTAYAQDDGRGIKLSALQTPVAGKSINQATRRTPLNMVNVSKPDESKLLQEPARRYGPSTTSHNVGPTSSTSGYANSELGSAASGNDEVPLAPAANGTGMGG